jgi:hypothetical protein
VKKKTTSLFPIPGRGLDIFLFSNFSAAKKG